jgi:hypothetical protein
MPKEIKRIEPIMEEFPTKYEHVEDNLCKVIQTEKRQVGWNCGIIEKINEIIDHLNASKKSAK